MKIFNSQQVKEIDRFTIENEPISSTSLMYRAAKQCAVWLMKRFDRSQTFKIFCGPGNNGGDGLAIAQILLENDYKAEVYIIKTADKLSPDAQYYFDNLNNQKEAFVKVVENTTNMPHINDGNVLIDALFGSGLNRPLEGLAAEVVNFLNKTDAEKIAIDIPSGLLAENNTADATIIRAHHTLTFQFPFLSFLFAENAAFVGGFLILNIGLHPAIINQLTTPYNILENTDIKIKQRPKFGHKGAFGHALLLAGCKEMSGAAVLSAKSCLHSGCGLVTVHSSRTVVSVIQNSFPEAITSTDGNENYISNLPDLTTYSAIAIGPGIGMANETGKIAMQLLKDATKPLVIDADALNIIARDKLVSLLPKKTIITPHPREFDRLFGTSQNSFERLQKQISASIKHQIIIVLKGKYTSICLPNGNCYFNSTGNAGMATAGSGDVLTGIICSFLAQGYEPEQAAITGVYLHGLAGDVAAETVGEEFLIASDIIRGLSKAFKKIKYTQ